jgi:tetratricopeptide (TPR) repeat protein
MSRAEDPVQELQRSLDDLTRAVDEDKNNATAWCVKGSTLADIGYYQGVSGSDATSSYQQAETDFTRALELDKDNYLTWMYRARVRENMGNNLNSKGENGASLISAAEQDLAKAIELRPDNPEPWAARAYLRTNRASLLSSQKKDPSKEFEAALEDCEQALKVNPDSIKALVQSGLTHHQWGVHKMNHGQDATPDYDAAELNPTLFTIWENRAFALINVAYYKRTQKQDPLPDYNQSEKWFQTALHLNDRRATTWMNFGQLYWARGWYRQETGRLEEARKDFSSAVRAFEEALRRNPALEPTLRRWLKESREKSR